MRRWLALTALLMAAYGRAAEPPAFTAKELVALPSSQWITNGGNIYNQRYSPLTEINSGNVAAMRAEWQTHMDGSGVGPPFTTVCCGWTSRGVAIGEGKVFLGRLDGAIVALDQRTGRQVWSVQAERWQDGFTITSAPLYFDGMIITGFAGGELAARGRVRAFSAKSGKLLWTFYTAPGPGEVGHESWPQDNSSWRYGGAMVWQTPEVDPKHGLIYFSTGNAGPDFNGSRRKGDNLFSVSIVAIEAKTGKYRWHFQQVHHDLWDYDSPSPVVLFDLQYNGQSREAIAEVGKTAWVYILDRVTGEPR